MHIWGRGASGAEKEGLGVTCEETGHGLPRGFEGKPMERQAAAERCRCRRRRKRTRDAVRAGDQTLPCVMSRVVGEVVVG